MGQSMGCSMPCGGSADLADYGHNEVLPREALNLLARPASDGWQHGLFVVPARPPSAYPRTSELMTENPFRWGSLHISSRAFVPALDRNVIGALATNLMTIPSPTIVPTSIELKRGWRTSLVLRAMSPDLAAIKALPFAGAEFFTRDAAAVADHAAEGPGMAQLWATLQYGLWADSGAGAMQSVDDPPRGLAAEAVLGELRELPWEFALVARRDLGERGGEADGLPRDLVIWSPSLGLREYHIEPPEELAMGEDARLTSSARV